MQLLTDSTCADCKHLKIKHTEFLFYCKAFPKGIPEDIIDGENKHNKPTETQENDIVFEAIK